ncbi:MAG: desulfoferrodoxin [Planctomycetota bacterium]|jgi:superoxide reductase|nr:desulfoferrodoxin [Planctomycetota bacterium]
MDVNAMYKCECGSVLEVAVPCDCGPDCEPSCCGKPMRKLVQNAVDAAKEKHVPVVEKIDGGYRVKVGSVPHPMTPEHWIVAIELLADGQILRQNLTPTDRPEAIFHAKAEKVVAREYCNLHGLWANA